MSAIMLLSDRHIDFFSAGIDQALKLKGIAETIDGPVAKIVLKTGNNIASPKIPDDWKQNFQLFMDEVIEKDYAEAAVILGTFLNEKIDIPGIDENTEALVFISTLQFAASLIKL